MQLANNTVAAHYTVTLYQNMQAAQLKYYDISRGSDMPTASAYIVIGKSSASPSRATRY